MADATPLKVVGAQVQQFTTGDTVPFAAVPFSGVSTPAGPLGSVPDYPVSGAGWLRLNVTDGAAFTGFTAGIAGQPLRVTSVSGLLRLVHDNTDSAAGNRLRHPRGLPVTLAQWESATYVYDAVEAYWLLTSTHTPTGSIVWLSHAPSTVAGFLPCDGAAVSRAVYGGLFSVISTTWGVGNGTSTFNVPDLRGRGIIGTGTGTGLTARTIGQTGGAETVVLTTAEMPSHAHGAGGTATQFQGRLGGTTLLSTVAGSFAYAAFNATDAQGGGGAHANMQPWSALSAWIRV